MTTYTDDSNFRARGPSRIVGARPPVPRGRRGHFDLLADDVTFE